MAYKNRIYEFKDTPLGINIKKVRYLKEYIKLCDYRYIRDQSKPEIIRRNQSRKKHILGEDRLEYNLDKLFNIDDYCKLVSDKFTFNLHIQDEGTIWVEKLYKANAMKDF